MNYPTQLQDLLTRAKAVQAAVPRLAPPPTEGLKPVTQQVLPFSLVSGTRGYIEKVVNQVNGAYENGWFDACAVMLRRLVETLIIEAYEHHGIADNIKDPQGDFVCLGELVSRALSEKSWNIGRNAGTALPRLKSVGDRSAHSRRFVAHRQDIEKLIDDLRVVVQELVYLAHLK